MKRLLALLSAIALVGCLDTTGPKSSDPLTETFATSLGIGDLHDATVWHETVNGTFYKEEVVGTGAVLSLPDPTDSLSVDYTGWLKSGTSFGTGTNTWLHAGGGTIAGLLDGMATMRVGGQRLVVMPSFLGYGSAGKGPIPPNATLIFRVKLNQFVN